MKIYGRKFFDQPINDDVKAYEILEKLLLVKETIRQLFAYWIIIISKKLDLSKQQTLDADPKAI